MADQQLDKLGFLDDRPDLEKALEEVRSDREEASKFAADPAAYLQSKGVNTEGLEMSGAELSDSDLEQVAGGGPTICGSIGLIICGSVGDELGDAEPHDHVHDH